MLSHMSALSLSLSTLDRWWVVAPSMLTDPSQHSKHQKERALCSWWPVPPNLFADDVVVSSRCQTVLSPVVSWRDWEMAWWAGAAWSILLTWPQRVSPPTYSFIYGRQLREVGDFHVRDKFIPEDAKYSPLLHHMKGLQFHNISFQQCPCFRSI